MAGSASRYLFSALASPGLCLASAVPPRDLPPCSSPRAPRAAREARRRVALPGWSPAPPPPAAPSPSSGSGRAAPGNLRTPQPMGGRRPGPLPFSGAKDTSSSLRSPPLAARAVAGRQLCLHAGASPAPAPPCARPGSQPPLHTSTPPSPTPRLSGPTESRRRAPRYRGTRPAYGESQITRVGGAHAPHPRQHGAAAATPGAAPWVYTPSSSRITPGEWMGSQREKDWDQV